MNITMFTSSKKNANEFIRNICIELEENMYFDFIEI